MMRLVPRLEQVNATTGGVSYPPARPFYTYFTPYRSKQSGELKNWRAEVLSVRLLYGASQVQCFSLQNSVVSGLFRRCRNYAYSCTRVFRYVHGATEVAVSVGKYQTLGFGAKSSYPCKYVLKFFKNCPDTRNSPTAATIHPPETERITGYSRVLKFNRGINTHGKLKGTYIRFLEACLFSSKKANNLKWPRRKICTLRTLAHRKLIHQKNKETSLENTHPALEMPQRLKAKHVLFAALQRALHDRVRIPGSKSLPPKYLIRSFLLSWVKFHLERPERTSLSYFAHAMAGSRILFQPARQHALSRLSAISHTKLMELATLEVFNKCENFGTKYGLLYLLCQPTRPAKNCEKVLKFISPERWSLLNSVAGRLGFAPHLGDRGGFPPSGDFRDMLLGRRLRLFIDDLIGAEMQLNYNQRDQLLREANSGVYNASIESVTRWKTRTSRPAVKKRKSDEDEPLPPAIAKLFRAYIPGTGVHRRPYQLFSRGRSRKKRRLQKDKLEWQQPFQQSELWHKLPKRWQQHASRSWSTRPYNNYKRLRLLKGLEVVTLDPEMYPQQPPEAPKTERMLTALCRVNGNKRMARQIRKLELLHLILAQCVLALVTQALITGSAAAEPIKLANQFNISRSDGREVQDLEVLSGTSSTQISRFSNYTSAQSLPRLRNVLYAPRLALRRLAAYYTIICDTSAEQSGFHKYRHSGALKTHATTNFDYCKPAGQPAGSRDYRGFNHFVALKLLAGKQTSRHKKRRVRLRSDGRTRSHPPIPSLEDRWEAFMAINTFATGYYVFRRRSFYKRRKVFIPKFALKVLKPGLGYLKTYMYLKLIYYRSRKRKNYKRLAAGNANLVRMELDAGMRGRFRVRKTRKYQRLTDAAIKDCFLDFLKA